MRVTTGFSDSANAKPGVVTHVTIYKVRNTELIGGSTTDVQASPCRSLK